MPGQPMTVDPSAPPAQPAPSAPAILDGVRVLDLTRIVAGPWCTQTLADLGAEVLKIERPKAGDDTRRMGPFLHDEHGRPTDDSALFIACNRGKQSVTIDFSRPAGADLVRRLAQQCDVVIDNFKSGGLKKLGLDGDSLRALKPELIACSISGYGHDGDAAGRAAYDFIMQGRAGLMSTCGMPDGPPTRTGMPITDLFTGLYATIAVIGALLHRQRTGEGQSIDLAMVDASVVVNLHFATGYLMGHGVPGRMGNRNPLAAPSDVYRVRDGHCIVASGNDGQFRALCQVLGHPEWAEDPRLASNPLRVANRAVLDDRLVPAIATWKLSTLLSALDEAGVPAGPIQSMDQVFADPLVQQRGLAMTVPHARAGTVPAVRSPLRFSATPVQHGGPPVLGQHTASVLADWLGLDQAALDALHAARVI